jgi:hypothetical protein
MILSVAPVGCYKPEVNRRETKVDQPKTDWENTEICIAQLVEYVRKSPGWNEFTLRCWVTQDGSRAVEISMAPATPDEFSLFTIAPDGTMKQVD